jgi:hypothetical protein
MSITEVVRRASDNKVIAHFFMFCGSFFLALVPFATYGLDLSPGFF